jgi:hypothetical protein
VPLIVVTPLLRPFAQDSCKPHRLKAIPEEEEPVEPQPPRLAELPSSSSSEDYDTPPDTPAVKPDRQGGRGVGRADPLDLHTAFGRLALSLEATDRQPRPDEIPPYPRGEGAAKKPWSPKALQHQLAEAGPPTQRTWQMEKELEKTLLKHYEEAKALEKKEKKEKEIKKEQP